MLNRICPTGSFCCISVCVPLNGYEYVDMYVWITPGSRLEVY